MKAGRKKDAVCFDIQQTLHGYTRGHECIASSTSISKSDQKLMLVLSDLSGSSRRTFKSYFTGYPLRESSYYAIAKTWCASELKRPGCVWTHTLLFTFQQLEKLETFSDLREFFQRPEEGSLDEKPYSKPIQFTPSSRAKFDEKAPNLRFHEVRDLLLAVYGPENGSASVLFIEDTDRYHSALVEVWLQQWFSLRSEFSFCSYALSPRKAEVGTYLDFQIAPRNEQRAFLGTEISGSDTPISNRACDSKRSLDDFELAAEDILHPFTNDLRKFLSNADDCEKLTKSHYPRLIKLFDCSKQPKRRSTIATALDLLIDLFPAPKSGHFYKSRFLGFEDDEFTKSSDMDASTLEALVYCSQPEVFPKKLLAIEQRTRKLWEANPHYAISLIEKMLVKQPNILGEDVVKAAAKKASISDLDQIMQLHQNLLLLFVAINPSLAADEIVWRGSIDFQKELLDKLPSDLPEDQKLFRGACDSIFCGASDQIAKDCIEKWGAAMTSAFLDFVESRIDWQSDNWTLLIKSFPDECGRWMRSKSSKISPASADLVVRYLGNDPRFTNCLSASDWWLLIQSVSQEVVSERHLTFAEAVLPFCLGGEASVSAMELVIFSFEVIHRQLENNSLNYDVWRRIEPSIPELSFFFQWDKCERLRRGVVNLFASAKWPTEGFLRLTSDRNLMRLLLYSAKATPEGRRLRERIEVERPGWLD